MNLIDFERQSLRPRRSLTLHDSGGSRGSCLRRGQDQVLEEGSLVLFGACFGLAVLFVRRNVRLFPTVASSWLLTIQDFELHHLHLLHEKIPARVVLLLLVSYPHAIGVRLLAR